MSPSLGNLIEAGLERYPWAARIPAEARNLPITDADAKAAWELYVELVTRVATQPLQDADGEEDKGLSAINKASEQDHLEGTFPPNDVPKKERARVATRRKTSREAYMTPSRTC